MHCGLLIVLVAEVTQPSLGVGYEIGRAVAMKKRILCLFRPESGRSEKYICTFVYNDIIVPPVMVHNAYS